MASRQHLMILSAAVCLLLFSMPISEARAQRTAGPLGIGVGSTTKASGLSLKQHAGPSAFQLTAGCWKGCDGIGASLDALASMPPLVSAAPLMLAWNFGAGGALGVGDGDLGAAASLVVGLELHLRPIPLELVIEWRPGLEIIPEPEPEISDFGSHLRIYF